MVERFTEPELVALRSEIIQGALDSRDAADLLQVFLMGKGYGVSREAALDAASTVEGAGCSVQVIQKELERLALVN